ncbi:Ubx domain-containing protein [Coemansia sp. RSA 518]|nr:Ubx domain-containing protein [Coemansia sp. RSA 522]KAJ2205007.1 Ubx domain-containing protein [Coemansia sp. RSA 521]KAJ2224965.1 Ubx domain-containing protein [Coemansia sp. RSA 518]KAJ2277736.1 Ubx domain-containing protein [Coemansia sp. RSA 370]
MADQHTNDKVLEGLSDSQRQSLHEFSQVTNANLDLAVRVLASRQWNTQQAIQMYYEPGYADALQKTDDAQEAEKDVSEGLRRRGVEASGSGRDTQSNVRGAESSGHNAEGGSRRKPEGSASRRPQFAITPLLVWPFVLMLRLAMLAASTLLRILGIQRIASSGVPNQTTITNDFEHYFEAHYGLEHPPFFHGTLADARTAALRDQKYIVMVLWSKEHDDADVFGRALAHPDVVACLTQPQFIVWADDLTQLDAYAAASDSGATHFPSISVLGPRAASAGLPTRLELVARMRNGPQTANAMAQSLVSFVTRVVASRDSMTRAMQREQDERDAERRLRAQQNAAYEASLARDQERDREQREQSARAREQEIKAREEEIKAKEEQDAEERRRREEQAVDEQRTQWRWAKLAQIHKENATELASADAAKLSLRLENGRRIVHSFARDSTMQRVFDFVETRDVADEWATKGVTPYGSDLAQITAPAGYTHTYEFALVSQFPRVVFDDRRATLHNALSACGLWPSAVLIAEPLFEPED